MKPLIVTVRFWNELLFTARYTLQLGILFCFLLFVQVCHQWLVLHPVERAATALWVFATIQNLVISNGRRRGRIGA